MSEEIHGKLNQLQRQLPEGLIVDSSWLKQRRYSAQLAQKYVTSGWLERIAHGVYRRPAGRLLWQHVIISLQTLMAKPLLVGGQTALSLHGFSDYLEREDRHIHLYGPHPAPAWLNKLPLTVAFHYHNSETLFANDPIHFGLTSRTWNIRDGGAIEIDPQYAPSLSVMPWGQWEWPLTLSTPERAVFEMLDGLPHEASFEQADKFFESLTTLRPRRLQTLLADCKSIKVKRLFFFFADRHQHPWRKHLDKDVIDLGRGKRSLVPSGRLDPTYLITVPEEFHGNR
jgi:hypothetical protein